MNSVIILSIYILLFNKFELSKIVLFSYKLINCIAFIDLKYFFDVVIHSLNISLFVNISKLSISLFIFSYIESISGKISISSFVLTISLLFGTYELIYL